MAKIKPFEKSKADKESKAKGKEGSPKEELFDAKQAPFPGMKCGGKVKKFAKGGSIDGCATRGKTKGRNC